MERLGTALVCCSGAGRICSLIAPAQDKVQGLPVPGAGVAALLVQAAVSGQEGQGQQGRAVLGPSLEPVPAQGLGVPGPRVWS